MKLLPLWSAGTLAKLAVSSTAGVSAGWAAMGVVAVLVSDSALPASSLKVTRTLMVLPSSAETSS